MMSKNIFTNINFCVFAKISSFTVIDDTKISVNDLNFRTQSINNKALKYWRLMDIALEIKQRHN